MDQKRNILRQVAYPAIDGIRFYAALAVFTEHVLGSAAVNYFGIAADHLSYQASSYALRALVFVLDGNHGVDVFFIISGFLMARIVLSERHPFNYMQFIGNRVRRIYPTFLVALVVAAAGDCLLFGWKLNAVDFAKNLVFLNAIPGLPVIAYNNVSWSLGFEFSFYLAIPALLLVSRFIDKRIAALLMLCAASWFLPDPYVRMKALFIGSLIGSIDDKDLSRLARAIPLWFPVLLYLGCAVAKALIFKTYLGYYYPFLASAALLFIKVVWCESNILNRLFRTNRLRTLGTLSYSIYLYHSIIASVVLYFFTPHPATLAGLGWYVAATSALTVAVSYASYSLIERRYFSRQTKKSRHQESLFGVQDRPS